MAIPSSADAQFEAAVRANTSRLVALARAMLGVGIRDSKQPEDLVQDALLKLFRHREQYDWADGAWSLMAKAVARNVISCRRRKIGASLDAEDALRESLGEDNDPAQATISEEAITQLRGLIEQLPDNWRGALVLREQQGMAYRDIAETLEATEAQVKPWLHRARARLATQLREADAELPAASAAGATVARGKTDA